MRFLWNYKILRSDNDHSHTDHAEFSFKALQLSEVGLLTIKHHYSKM